MANTRAISVAVSGADCAVLAIGSPVSDRIGNWAASLLAGSWAEGDAVEAPAAFEVGNLELVDVEVLGRRGADHFGADVSAGFAQQHARFGEAGLERLGDTLRVLGRLVATKL